MPADQPNIVLVVTDQQRLDTIRSLGHAHAETPHLDRLVEEGVAFTNCHLTAPSCVPSRASLFTGYYPHATGVHRNGDPWRPGWVETLADAGYYTVNVGKMHTKPYEAAMGFDERYVVENKDRYLADRYYFDEWDKALRARGLVKQQRELYRERDDYEERMGAFEWELPEDAHADNFVGDLATWWLDAKPARDEPLFLQVGFPGPHPPFDPVPRYAERFLDRDLPIPDVTDADLASQPPPFRALREHNAEVDHDSVVHDLDPDDDQLHRLRAYYHANVAMIDAKVGELLDALARNGYLDDAVVVFVSDHGEALGEHGHVQKWTMYESVTNVPLVVWSPDRFDGGRTVDGLCQHMDVAPTLLELADASVPDSMQAASLSGALRGDDWTGREHVYAEHGPDAVLQEVAYVSMVRSRRWKLVHFLDAPYGQLFDLDADPGETDNRWDDPAVADVKRELLDELLAWRIRSQYDARERVRE